MAWMDGNSPDWCEVFKGKRAGVDGKWLIYPGTHSCLDDAAALRVVEKIKPFLDLIEPSNSNDALLGVWDRWAFSKEEWEQLLEAGNDSTL